MAATINHPSTFFQTAYTREWGRSRSSLASVFFSSQGLVDLARESEGTSSPRAKSVQRRTEGQLKDHTVFPSGNTVSSAVAGFCRPWPCRPRAARWRLVSPESSSASSSKQQRQYAGAWILERQGPEGSSRFGWSRHNINACHLVVVSHCPVSMLRTLLNADCTPFWPYSVAAYYFLIVGALVTWAIYTQGQLLLWSSLIITGVVPGYK